jgi:hypothetical protein
MSTSKLGPLAQIAQRTRHQGIAGVVRRHPGTAHLYTYGTLAFFDCGARGTCNRRPSQNESILYLRVEDIRAAYDTLRARGVAFDGARMIHRHADGTEEWLATFRDPEGRPL